MRKLFLSVASLILAAGNMNATSIGYSKETIVRTNIFRLGTTTTQGQAIRLSKAKLQALKGKSIDFAEFVVGSKNSTGNNMHVFIATSLHGTPITESDIKISRAFQKCKWTLDKPYTITGEEENLYIGYTAEIPTTYKMLLSDGGYDISGYNFAYNDGEWVDTYGTNRGSAYISVNVEDAGSFTDAIIGRSNFDGYFKAGTSYDFAARFINAGTTDITSFDAEIEIGNKSTTQHFDGISIKPKEGYSFKLAGVDCSKEGEQSVKVNITNVNNGNNDIDPSDNAISGDMFFYPNNMERSLLVEGFTGQDCSQCPNGHLELTNAINLYGGSMVEVSHHIGYYPDMFTMQEDQAYLFYYSNPSATSAPALMVNRNTDTSVTMAPVANVTLNNACSLLSHADLSKPYVSLNLETALDKSTRELKVKLGIKPHTELPSENVLFNVFLVQDSIQAYQSNGGTNYTHNRVFRGTVTGNSWGIIAKDMQPGKVTSWETSITIPEKIHSSYWTDDMLQDAGGKKMYDGKYDIDQTNIEAVLKNMTVVAYVAEYDNSDNTKNVVYNCCEAKLGESYKQKGFEETSGVNTIEKDNDANIYVRNGNIFTTNDNSKIYVYNIDGRQVDVGFTLAKGIYVVKTVTNGKQTTKKIFVR